MHSWVGLLRTPRLPQTHRVSDREERGQGHVLPPAAQAQADRASPPSFGTSPRLKSPRAAPALRAGQRRHEPAAHRKRQDRFENVDLTVNQPVKCPEQGTGERNVSSRLLAVIVGITILTPIYQSEIEANVCKATSGRKYPACETRSCHS